MQVTLDEITTSREAALACLERGLWGCIAAPADRLSDVPGELCRLGDDPSDYVRVDGFLFLSTAAWTSARPATLERAPLDRPRPLLLANGDLADPRKLGTASGRESGWRYVHILGVA